MRKIISDKFPHLKIHPFFKSKIGKIISIVVTQYFVFLAWIPFRAHNTEDMMYSIQKYIFIDFMDELGHSEQFIKKRWKMVRSPLPPKMENSIFKKIVNPFLKVIQNK